MVLNEAKIKENMKLVKNHRKKYLSAQISCRGTNNSTEMKLDNEKPFFFKAATIARKKIARQKVGKKRGCGSGGVGGRK